MIVGLGSDLVDISRIEGVEFRSNGRFSQRILGFDEYLVYQTRKRRSEAFAFAYLAKRFAAKEAFSKSIGSGVRSPLNLRHIQILSNELGKPVIFLTGGLACWANQKRLNFFVTLSDTKQMAMAVVLASREEKIAEGSI